MEAKETKQGKVIGNVGVLDLRNATEASIAEIRRIGNVGVAIHSSETAGLLIRLNMGNVGASIEVSSDARMLSGQVVFNRDYFKNQATPLNLLVSGQLLIHPDVSVEDLQQGLKELIVSGQVICPEHLSGAIQSRMRYLSGQFQICAQHPKLVVGKLTLDETALRSLDDASELVVVGKLNVPRVLPNDLLAQKIQKVQVIGRIVCHEENAEILLAHLDDKTGLAKVTTVPAGFELAEKPMVLDADLLSALPARKFYCTERVQIEPDVEANALDDALEALVIKDMIICPAALKEVIACKCNMLETRAVFYEEELWLVDDKLDLLESRFDYSEGKVTLVVSGKLTVAPDIDPKVLVERLAKVHNLGKIRCTPEQMGAIQSLLGLSDGKLEDSTKEKEKKKEENFIGNVGTLRL